MMHDGDSAINPLFVFDFDDTLVKSNAKVTVTHANGVESQLSTHAFATYKPKPGDRYNFDEFDRGTATLRKTSLFKKFVSYIAEHGQSAVMILTARSKAAPVKKFLQKNGVKGIRIVALNTLDPTKKADWIEKKIDRDDHDYIEFYDDSSKNVYFVKSLSDLYPDVEIVTYWVRW